jgi:hypothetical protein
VSKVVPLQVDIYNILINNKYNNFTIAEFRDELVNCSNTFTDNNMARKFIYRQVYRLLNKELLIKIKNSGDKKARYIKSELFKETSFISKKLSQTLHAAKILKNQHSPSISTLEKEKIKLQENLAVVNCEANVYSELITRLPEQALHLKKFQTEAKIYSINLMGKINALEKVLSVMN